MIITMPLSYTQASTSSIQQQLQNITSQLIASASSPLPLPEVATERPPTLRSQASKQTIRRKPVPYKSQEEMRAASRSVESLSLHHHHHDFKASAPPFTLRQSRSFDVSVLSPRASRPSRWSTGSGSESAESLDEEALAQEVEMRDHGPSMLPTPALSSTQSSLFDQLSPSGLQSAVSRPKGFATALITPPPSAASFPIRQQAFRVEEHGERKDQMKQDMHASDDDGSKLQVETGGHGSKKSAEIEVAQDEVQTERVRDATVERVGYWDYSIVSFATLQPSTHEPMPTTLAIPPTGPAKRILRSARRRNISRSLIRSQSLIEIAQEERNVVKDRSMSPETEAFQDVSESDYARSSNTPVKMETSAQADEAQGERADKRSTQSSWEGQTSRLVAIGSSPAGSMSSKDTDLGDVSRRARDLVLRAQLSLILGIFRILPPAQFEIASTVELPSSASLNAAIQRDARNKPFQPVFHFPSPPASSRHSSVPSVFSHRLSDISSRHVRKPAARASIASVLSRSKHAAFGHRQYGSLFDGLDEIGKAISESEMRSASPASAVSSRRSTILLDAISRAISLPSLASLNKALPPLPASEEPDVGTVAEPEAIYTGIALSTDNLLPVPSRVKSSTSFDPRARRSRLNATPQRGSRRASRSLLKTKRSFVIEGNDILDNPIEMVALDRPTVTFTATPEDFARFEQGAQAPTRMSWRGVLAGCFRLC